LINQIALYHEKEFDEKPSVIASAPGKVDLLGEHGEESHGSVLSFAVDLRFYVAVSERDDNSFRFFSVNLDERKKSTIAGLKFKREDRWANYIKGVADSLIHMGYALRGVNFTLESQIPMGVGMASSSAMTVAAVTALDKLFNLQMGDAEKLEVAKASERDFMNIPQEIRSPMVSYYARADNFLMLDVNTLKVEYLPFKSSSLLWVITDSGVQENMSEDEKKEIDKSCRECVEALGLKGRGQLIKDFSKEDLSGSIEGLSERSRRICLHIIRENKRVEEFRRAVEEQSSDAMGRVLFHSHEGLRDFLEISCPELDWLTRRSLETEGIYGSRMIGRGYGGCTVTLLEKDRMNLYEEHLEEYDRIFGFKANVYNVKLSDGVKIHFPEK